MAEGLMDAVESGCGVEGGAVLCFVAKDEDWV